jgi:hypothetical protein
MQNDDDVICIAFKRLPEGGYVALDSENKPIKAFSTYQELEWDTVCGMRKVCGSHPNDGLPKFVGEEQPPLRDAMPTQPARQSIASRVVNLASRATR